MKDFVLLNDDMLKALDAMPANSVDAVITDPPYELGFMGNAWDNTGITFSAATWKKVLRVLKPGGHLLAFNHSRMSHRMVVAIEDAGFEIRDTIMWVYGSGFPKSYNIGKAIDKIGGESGNELINDTTKYWSELIEKSGKTNAEIAKVCGVSTALVRFWKLGQRNIQLREAKILGEYFGISEYEIKTLATVELTPTEREVIGIQKNAMSGWNTDGTTQFKDREITKGTSEWEGWGTALKPAYEPITLARKPLGATTIAANVLKYGVGGINIDESRVGTETITTHSNGSGNTGDSGIYSHYDTVEEGNPREGRFPANLIHDGSEEVLELFPHTKSGKMTAEHTRHTDGSPNGIYGKFDEEHPLAETYGDEGSAARFFYCAKANKSDRGDNNHPTVKPTDLMQYLVRLITPKGGVVLDPFMGSGSTGKAVAILNSKENRDYGFIGIELEKEYYEIAAKRIQEVK